jgi:hypothetical protein
LLPPSLSALQVEFKCISLSYTPRLTIHLFDVH